MIAVPASCERRLRVLVVDDSATVRQAMATILGRERTIEVATAADPLFALAKIQKQRPDVIITDLEMPRMDGLTFLRRIMAIDPIPTIICSARTGAAAEAAMQALEEGATSVVTKPRLGVWEFLEESAVSLIDAVRGAAAAKPRRTARRTPVTSAPVFVESRPPAGDRPRPRPAIPAKRILVIGASTGGTEALRDILEEMPSECPGIVIVQHMPEGFTRAFADRINRTCAIEVKEAEDGDLVLEGRALIAPGNRHLRLLGTSGRYRVEVTDGPLVSRHRPSVDVLFTSAAATLGGNAVGVLLTGMGEDGARGLAEMRDAGAWAIAQDEATCVVFGMPRAAILMGAVDEVVALPEIGRRMLSRARATSLQSVRA